MHLRELFAQQDWFESHIKRLSTIDDDHLGQASGTDLRLLALIVKVSEFASISKCYKFGVTPEHIDRERLEKSYIGVFQYFLSIGLITGYSLVRDDVIRPRSTFSDPSLVLIDVFGSIQRLKSLSVDKQFIDGINTYIDILNALLDIGRYFGYSLDTVAAFYRRQQQRIQVSV